MSRSYSFNTLLPLIIIFSIYVISSTSYISKQEGTKTIVEGSGSVKWKDDQKPANFKYIRTILSDGAEVST